MNSYRYHQKYLTPLSPISEVYSTDRLTISQDQRYLGLIKRDSDIVSLWQPRFYVLSYFPGTSLDLTISKKKDGPAQEIIDLTKTRVTKKCSSLDGNPCFGIILPNKMKYLISLANVHECGKMHGEIILAHQFLKQQYVRATKQQVISKIQTNYNKKNGHYKNQLLEDSQYQSLLRIKSKRHPSIQRRVQQDQQQYDQKEIEVESESLTLFCQRSTSEIYATQIDPKNLSFEYLNKNEQDLLEKDENFRLYANIPGGNLFSHFQNCKKGILSLKNSLDIYRCMIGFLQMDLWNSQVKKIEILQKNQPGVYVIYMQFAEEGILDLGKYTYAIVSFWQNDREGLMVIKTLRKDYTQNRILKKRINLKILMKISYDKSNNEQKIIRLVLLTDKESLNFCSAYMGELKRLNSYLSKDIKTESIFCV